MNSLKVDAKHWSFLQSVKDVSSHIDLLFSFVRRDVKVRYVQTRLGILWAIIQPVVAVVIFTFLFNVVLNFSLDTPHYPSFAFAGVILWNYFSKSFSTGGQSLVQAQSMIKKVWFPKIVLPLSKAVVGLVDLFIGFIVLLIVILLFSQWQVDFFGVLLILLSFFLAFLSSAGLSFWAAASSIRYRDIQQLLPIIIQLGFFITPVVIPTEVLMSKIPESFQYLLYLNPMVGVIDLFRAGLGMADLSTETLGMSLLVSTTYFVLGWIYFSFKERQMPDWL